MEDIKETILQQCLTIFKREEVKEEFVDLMKPVIQMLLKTQLQVELQVLMMVDLL